MKQGDGYFKWRISGFNGDRWLSLKTDGERYRCMQLIAKMGNKKVFPGLFASNSLVPKNELELLGSCYSSDEFRSDYHRKRRYSVEKGALIGVGLLLRHCINGREFLYAKDYHSLQDVGVPRTKSMGYKFVTAWFEIQDNLRVKYLSLLLAFKPKGVRIIEESLTSGLTSDVTDVLTVDTSSGLTSRLYIDKYNIDKYNIYNIGDEQCSSDIPFDLILSISYDRKTNSKEPEETDGRVREFIDWFCLEYPKHTAGGKYHVVGGKDGSVIKYLLRTFSLGDLQRAAGLMFSDSWIKENRGFSIGILSAHINSLLSRKVEKSEDEKLAEWVKA